jgi:hypothetical protein
VFALVTPVVKYPRPRATALPIAHFLVPVKPSLGRPVKTRVKLTPIPTRPRHPGLLVDVLVTTEIDSLSAKQSHILIPMMQTKRPDMSNTRDRVGVIQRRFFTSWAGTFGNRRYQPADSSFPTIRTTHQPHLHKRVSVRAFGAIEEFRVRRNLLLPIWLAIVAPAPFSDG